MDGQCRVCIVVFVTVLTYTVFKIDKDPDRMIPGKHLLRHREIH